MKYLPVFLIFVVQLCASAELDSVSDDDLVHLFKKDTYLVVLFSKQNCPECDKFEGLLFNLKSEIKEQLDSDVVKAVNSQLARLYSPTKEPALVFFRHGVPLLYDGPISDHVIMDKFNQNREPNVKELTDDIFEHLTQASTGSTTGDWFILFYRQECVECQRLTAVWEAVAASLKTRMNIARINVGTVGILTGKRFNVKKFPEFILIRQGKFYRYEITNRDVKSFVTFASEWYKNATPEKIAKPSTPFDDLFARCTEYLKIGIEQGFKMYNDYPYAMIAIVSVIGFVILIMMIKNMLFSKATTPSESKKTKPQPKAQDQQPKKKKASAKKD